MNKLLITGLTAISIAICSCTGTDKTNRVSDTSAAKGSGGPADSSKTTGAPSSAVTPGSSDTSSMSKDPAEPMGDTVKKKTPQ